VVVVTPGLHVRLTVAMAVIGALSAVADSVVSPGNLTRSYAGEVQERASAEGRSKPSSFSEEPDDELPALIRRQPTVVHDAWRRITAAIRENNSLARPRPEPFFARAELWIMVGNYDEAMRDLLLAMRNAESSGAAPSNYQATFERLREVLDRYDATPVPPEDGEPSWHYGRGMHEFWAGRYVEAERAFTNAIMLAPQNPLFWYMRAVARRRQGNDTGAQHDVLLGATAERRRCVRSFASVSYISRDLSRLQGPDRLWLEEHRSGDPARRTMSGLTK